MFVNCMPRTNDFYLKYNLGNYRVEQISDEVYIGKEKVTRFHQKQPHVFAGLYLI